MNPEEMSFLYAYNRWANRRTLAVASPLTPDEFLRVLGSSFPSVRDTLAHILAAEWIWLERWKGNSPGALLDAREFGTLADLRKRWEEVEREQAVFVASVTEASLSRTVSYVNTKGETWSYPLGQMMQHLVNHSSYHRGQVTGMLRQLDREPAPTDLLLFIDEGSPT